MKTIVMRLKACLRKSLQSEGGYSSWFLLSVLCGALAGISGAVERGPLVGLATVPAGLLLGTLIGTLPYWLFWLPGDIATERKLQRGIEILKQRIDDTKALAVRCRDSARLLRMLDGASRDIDELPNKYDDLAGWVRGAVKVVEWGSPYLMLNIVLQLLLEACDHTWQGDKKFNSMYGEHRWQWLFERLSKEKEFPSLKPPKTCEEEFREYRSRKIGLTVAQLLAIDEGAASTDFPPVFPPSFRVVELVGRLSYEHQRVLTGLMCSALDQSDLEKLCSRNLALNFDYDMPFRQCVITLVEDWLRVDGNAGKLVLLLNGLINQCPYRADLKDFCEKLANEGVITIER